MAEDPQPMTLQQRIAALNAAHIGRLPGDPPPTARAKPEMPSRRPPIVKQNSINIPHEQVNGSVAETRIGNQPNGPPPQLPVRKQIAPPLPSRNSSEQSSRRPSVASTNSTATTDTTGSRLTKTRTTSEDGARIKAPAWGECELPPLPPKVDKSSKLPVQVPERPKYNNRVSSFSKSTAATQGQRKVIPVTKPTLPPPLPSRKSSSDTQDQSRPSENPSRRLPPVPSAASLEKARQSAFSYDSKHTEAEMVASNGHVPEPVQTTRSVGRTDRTEEADSRPPPVPLASRPDLAALQATKPKFSPQSTSSTASVSNSSVSGCMTCRDFSGPDTHAARFPRHTVNSLPSLAQQLTASFTSPTDKARAIFTWLHHNIAYDVVSFFNNNVQGSTPQSTLQSGLAVCEGYAALFTNLATHAGLESVVIGGHGKGYGYSPLTAGSAIPPFKCGHAWNAVRIDHGEWKLIDPCWGAGHVQGKGKPYVPHFNPSQFTMSNEEFGVRHFPENKNYFFLPGGRQVAWQDYISLNPERWPYDCDRPTIFCNAKTDYFIGERTVLPVDRKIRVNHAGNVRFQFSLLCEHWTMERHSKNGLPPVFILAVHGLDGRKEDYVALEHVRGSTPGGGGDFWCADVPARELGAPGQKITVFAVTSFGNRQNCRGLTVREFNQGKGRTSMAFAGVAAWELV